MDTESKIMAECLEELRFQKVLPIITDNQYWKNHDYPDPETAARDIAKSGSPELDIAHGLLAFALYQERIKELTNGNGKGSL